KRQVFGPGLLAQFDRKSGIAPDPADSHGLAAHRGSNVKIVGALKNLCSSVARNRVGSIQTGAAVADVSQPIIILGNADRDFTLRVGPNVARMTGVVVKM